MRTFILMLVLAAGVQASAETCFWADQIWSFRVENGRDLIVRESGGKEYALDLPFCNNLDWTQKVAFRTFISNRVCQNDKALLFEDFFSNRPTQICRISGIKALK